MPQRLKAGEAVIELLKQEGVSHIFGIVGSSFLDILDPLYDREDMRFVGVRHEQGAALMADGFSRISGAPSVCLATNGPGVLNLTYGIGSAYVAHSPVVVIAPSASRRDQYRNSTQEFDQVALFKPITKASFPINRIDRLPDALRHAFRVATSGKMGPVLLDIPRDLLPGADVELDLLPPDAYRPGQTRSRGDLGLVRRAADVLAAAQRPVILAGGRRAMEQRGWGCLPVGRAYRRSHSDFLRSGRCRSFRPSQLSRPPGPTGSCRGYRGHAGGRRNPCRRHPLGTVHHFLRQPLHPSGRPDNPD